MSSVSKSKIILLVHNVRSAYNVGSMLRTADGLAVQKVYLTGYTPYPQLNNDPRLPHIAMRDSKKIAKTALGAEETILWSHQSDALKLINTLKKSPCLVIGLEQAASAQALPDFKTEKDLVLIVGNEVHGVDQTILQLCDMQLQIPMLGSKESFNVAAAAAMALYHLRFIA